MNRPAVLLLHCSVAVALCALVSGCGGVRDQFVGSRVEDACGGEWPICSTTVGCFLGDRSYVESRFPGRHRVAIQIFEPSTVTVSFLLSEVAGAGELTVMNLWEDRCRARSRVEVTGKAFIGEAEKSGYISRSAELSGVGDHLVEVESDARARYLMKVDVLPLRLQNQQ